MEGYIKGVDISTLLDEEKCGARYYDNGREGELIAILKRYGINSARLRIWNDPYSEAGETYGSGSNDLDNTLILARRVKAAGMSILLDFHYSDFWADPGKQILPKAWRGKSVEELEEAVYEYTLKVMQAMEKNDTVPDMVQIGNEVTNGLMWPTGRKPEYGNIARYISAGIRAVRETAPNTQIMIHLDNGGNNEMYVDWFDHYLECGADFDIIGLSYYPFWHGSLSALEYNLNDMARRYGKKLCIAEVSMGFSMEDYRSYEGGDPNLLKGYATKKELVKSLEFPMTKQGQCDFMKAVMDLINNVPGGMGFYYWEPGWIPVPGCGWANEAALRYTGEAGPGGNEWANQALFDYDGNVNPALETIRDYM